MELVALRTFQAVVEEGGILAASRKLNTVQSNVTSRIRRLEEELGTELFFRKGRGIELAPSGRVLLEYARRMLLLERQTTAAMRQVGESAGELRIGTMETFAALHLPAALKAVRAAHPALELRVQADTSAALTEKVLDHKLDCAFVAGPVKHPDLQFDELVVEELVQVCADGAGPQALPLIRLCIPRSGACLAACERAGVRRRDGIRHARRNPRLRVGRAGLDADAAARRRTLAACRRTRHRGVAGGGRPRADRDGSPARRATAGSIEDACRRGDEQRVTSAAGSGEAPGGGESGAGSGTCASPGLYGAGVQTVGGGASGCMAGAARQKASSCPHAASTARMFGYGDKSTLKRRALSTCGIR